MSDAAASASSASAWSRRTSLSAFLLFLIAYLFSQIRGNLFPLYLVQTQDVPVLILLSISILVSTLWNPATPLPDYLPSTRVMLIIGIAVVALLGLGSYVLMEQFPLSRDEHMVIFDMAVFDKKRLAEPLAVQWRPYAQVLVPAFLLNETMPIGLVSAYLPMNALLRLAFSKVADPAYFNPSLVLLGGIALVDISKRIFAAQQRACWVVLLVYGLSAQMLVNAMTTYSMTAHMALNLVWLAAFLRGGRAGHAIAIITGFIATGLHQLAFHPAFVAPFLLWRLRQGEIRVFVQYGIAYCGIILWWAAYPLLVAREVAQSITDAPQGNIIERLTPLLLHRDASTMPEMVLNLARFITWQNFALLPLLTAAVPVALRHRSLAGPLFSGIILWLVFITIVLPFQGHGWGYRYLHPYLGSFALLSGFGYIALRERIGAKADGIVIMLSGVTAVAAIPLLFAAAHNFVAPHVAMEHLIAAQTEPMVLVDTEPSAGIDGRWTVNAIDLVRNAPDLSNRPLRFSSRALNSRLLSALCRKGPITLITRADMRRLGFGMNVPAKSPRFEVLVGTVAENAPGCFRPASNARMVETSADLHRI